MTLDNQLKKTAGFTLIELLVVLTIGMLLISLVGGVGMNMVDKTNAQTEVNKFKSLLRESSFKAYLCRCTQTINVTKHQVAISEGSKNISVLNFKKLKFNDDIISFHRTGLPSVESVRYYQNGEWQTMDLIALLNSEF